MIERETTMSLEAALNNIALALQAVASALEGGTPAATTDKAAAPKRGRPRSERQTDAVDDKSPALAEIPPDPDYDVVKPDTKVVESVADAAIERAKAEDAAVTAGMDELSSRAATLSLKAVRMNREGTVALLRAFGVDRVTQLPHARLAEYIQQLQETVLNTQVQS